MSYIWEIKAASLRAEAPAQIARYINGLPGAQAGWGLPVSPYIPDLRGGALRAWSLSQTDKNPYGNGIRLYADARRQRQQQVPDPCGMTVASTNGGCALGNYGGQTGYFWEWQNDWFFGTGTGTPTDVVPDYIPAWMIDEVVGAEA